MECTSKMERSLSYNRKSIVLWHTDYGIASVSQMAKEIIAIQVS